VGGRRGGLAVASTVVSVEGGYVRGVYEFTL